MIFHGKPTATHLDQGKACQSYLLRLPAPNKFVSQQLATTISTA